MPLYEASAAPSAGQGCFGRLSNQPLCSAPAGVPLPPFRKPHQPRTIGTPRVADAAVSGPVLVQAQSFRRLSLQVGEWSGIVTGRGEINLALQILEQGRVTNTRWIGTVTLASQPSTFHFRSSIPTVPDWSWKIIAAATPSPAARSR